MNTELRRAARITVLPPKFRYECTSLTYEGMLEAGWYPDQALVTAVSIDDILHAYRISGMVTGDRVIEALCQVIRDNHQMCQKKSGSTTTGVNGNESI